jgi:L,D-transpeptidase YbiS
MRVHIRNGATESVLFSKWFLIWTLILGFIYYNSENLLREITITYFPLKVQADDSVSWNEQDSIQMVRSLTRKTSTNLRKLQRLMPQEPYLVVNTILNNFRLYSKGIIQRQGLCSTGSYVLLDAEAQQWVFRTPQGRYHILGKITNPVWRKPDWAFVEAGLPVPSGNSPSRYEYGVLGDYALSLGEGYLIHGTLYQRLLGMPVTHGCVRLADEDLQIIYKALNIGSKVYIL